MRTIEGDKITLNCAFLAMPAASLDIVWLADLAGSTTTQRKDSHRERDVQLNDGMIVLYDSRIHSRIIENNETSWQRHEVDLWAEFQPISDYSRLIIRDQNQPRGEPAIRRSSQLTIEVTQADNSTR